MPGHFFRSSPPLESYGLERWVQINMKRSCFRRSVVLSRPQTKRAVEQVTVVIG